MIQSLRDASIAFATMLLCACTFTGHWLWAVGFAAVLFPWSFFGCIVEEHVLPWLMQWKILRPDKWVRDAQGGEAPVHFSRLRNAPEPQLNDQASSTATARCQSG